MTPPVSNFPARLRKYCALTERCTYDVMKKMTDWNVPEEDMEALLQPLYDEGFVDDGRYARSFASDQWRFQQWGRIKIRHALWRKQLDEALIQAALDEIPQEKYVRMIVMALEKKWNELQQPTGVAAGQKVLSFARQRGYEDELVFPWLEKNGLLGDEG